MTGSYVIEASGASGGNGTVVDLVSQIRWKWKRGGLETKITGTFQVNSSENLGGTGG